MAQSKTTLNLQLFSCDSKIKAWTLFKAVAFLVLFGLIPCPSLANPPVVTWSSESVIRALQEVPELQCVPLSREVSSVSAAAAQEALDALDDDAMAFGLSRRLSRRRNLLSVTVKNTDDIPLEIHWDFRYAVFDSIKFPIPAEMVMRPFCKQAWVTASHLVNASSSQPVSSFHLSS